MDQQQILDNLIINENAYFYHNANDIRISKSAIENLFKDVSCDKRGRYLLKTVRKSVGNGITFSVCVFKYECKPTLIEEDIEGWNESKIAYLLIVEVEDYIVISRKNISNIHSFIKLFYSLDYTTLSTLFVDSETSFEKFNLQNLNVSDKALRGKSLEALDLKENFPSLGASNYILNSMRVKNNEEKVSVMLNSSRINKFGNKLGIERFCDWSFSMINKIKSHRGGDTFLSIFAEPQDYENMRNDLIPISILFVLSKFHADYENGRITGAFVRMVSSKKLIDRRITYPLKHIAPLEKTLNIANRNGCFYVENTTAKDLKININTKSITLQSRKMKNVILRLDDDSDISFIDYVNKYSNFIINFEDLDLVYSNRKLFKDSKLLGNIDYFMDIFIPHEELSTVNSEKGELDIGNDSFSDGSIFSFVETNFSNEYDFFVCDDLGREWADHIGINDDTVAFYLSKYNVSTFSATSFQDIVGQAQKNLGNLTPQDYQLEGKRDFWSAIYPRTNIQRLRKGESANNFVQQFKRTLRNIHLKRKCYLVINFISKSKLQENLMRLQHGERFGERNETIQILWFISSLVSSCKEVNADVYVCCKP
jgi:hypothetical protein